MKLKTLILFGTRPEAIKLAPVINTLRQEPSLFDVSVCVTSQHREMLAQVLDFFSITPDFDLALMRPRQTLFNITTRALEGLQKVLTDLQPDLIMVQGDTTSSFAGALAGYYMNVKVAHIEAGLRSFQKRSPFPEEMNRILTGHLADFHFAPTAAAVENLRREGITENVWEVGNTVIDALLLGLKIIHTQGDEPYLSFFRNIDFSKKIILVTGHRRESFGEPFEAICLALKEIVASHPDTEIVYPVHLNPNVTEPVYRILGNQPRIHLMEPLSYPRLIWLMSRSYLVLTDSGGIQEEAPSLGKPVLVMREVTERTEGIQAGTARLVGRDKQVIIEQTGMLLRDPQLYQAMSYAVNPYGDGHSADQIKAIIMNVYQQKS